jgi:hypothetical protein
VTSLELFLDQRHRRFGTENPERMRLAHWEYMVRTMADPWLLREEFGIDPFPPAPDWCFERFGMTRTAMPDGRIICIAGEHEDSYDPDFCIYNDVVVLRPEAERENVTSDSGDVEIYGYPEEEFPPTDFHTATLVGNHIWIIGALGYRGARRVGHTPVYRLDTRRYRIDEMTVRAPSPGWISQHHAEFDPRHDAIVVRGGQVVASDDVSPQPSLAAHLLHLDTLSWECIAKNERHRKFQVEHREGGLHKPTEASFQPTGVAHTWLGTRDAGVDEHTISINFVRITFRSFYSTIEVEVEGELDEPTLSKALGEVRRNIEAESKGRWSIREVDRFERDT